MGEKSCKCYSLFCVSAGLTCENIFSPIDNGVGKQCCYKATARNQLTCGGCTCKCLACTCSDDACPEGEPFYYGVSKACCQTAKIQCPPTTEIGLACCGIQ